MYTTNSHKFLCSLLALFSLLSCTIALASDNAETKSPPLPQPSANNAVATLNIDDTQFVFSFMGLFDGKTHHDVHNKAWQLKIENDEPATWQAIPDVPSSLSLKGRLASVAVGVNDSVYLFGGYTVASDHSEISTPDVYKYNPITATYSALRSMPVPVDDAVALVYQSRFIYLISGWHNDGNVNLVQIYDTKQNTWQQGSPFLGKPVFGHAGGIVDNVMVVCDGVSIIPHENKRRSFGAETACFRGEINKETPTKIDWRVIEHPTKKSRYRMASAGDNERMLIHFVGGSTTPYNYNGIGYDGKPAEPDNAIWSYDITNNSWSVVHSSHSTMDHRGLLNIKGTWYTVGGMKENQTVTGDTVPHITTY